MSYFKSSAPISRFDDFLSAYELILSGELVLIPIRKQMRVFGILTIEGTLVIEGRLIVG